MLRLAVQWYDNIRVCYEKNSYSVPNKFFFTNILHYEDRFEQDSGLGERFI